MFAWKAPSHPALGAPVPWTRGHSLVVLASFMDRPPNMAIPPALERERVANLLRAEVDEVTRRYWMFHRLAGGDGEPPEPRERKLWNEFEGHPLECAMAADEWLAERRRLPHYLK